VRAEDGGRLAGNLDGEATFFGEGEERFDGFFHDD
jgi:hypothetical protein